MIDLLKMHVSFLFFLQASAAFKKRERKGICEDAENTETEAPSSDHKEEAPGSLNITDEMKRMLSQL